MIHRFPMTIFGLFMSAGMLLAHAPARAAESYDNCSGFISSLPATINTQGTWCLDRNLNTGMVSGAAITVNTNNVTIDCNHFKLGGLPAGPGTETYGIRADNRVNVSVRNCSIRGFFGGIFLFGDSSGGHLVEDNSLDSNTWVGIFVVGDGSVVQRNQVRDTGGCTICNVAYGISTQLNVDVLDNIVEGVLPNPSVQGNAQPTGIHTSENSSGRIHRNSVRGLVAAGAFVPRGIYNTANLRIHLRDNDLSGDGTGVGLHCQSSSGTAKDNIVSGFATGINTCGSGGGNAIVP